MITTVVTVTQYVRIVGLFGRVFPLTTRSVAVSMLALNIQVVPPTGLFTLTVTTVLRTSLSMATHFVLETVASLPSSLAPTSLTNGPKTKYTKTSTTKTLSNGQTRAGPTLLKEVGSPENVPPRNSITNLVRNLVKTLLRKLEMAPLLPVFRNVKLVTNPRKLAAELV